MDRLFISETKCRDYALIEVSGSIDASSYPKLQQRLHALLRSVDVVLDLSRVSSLSSPGLGALVAAVDDSVEFGSRFSLRSPSSIVRLSLESCGFTQLFRVVEDDPPPKRSRSR